MRAVSAADRDKWNARHREAEASQSTRPPRAFLVDLEPILQRDGRALDIAGGRGFEAVWLASRGLDTTLVDTSTVALEHARARASRAGVALTTLELDLQTEPLPPGPWTVVTCFDYLQRELFAAIRDQLEPGGLVLFAGATKTNLERHAHPSARFLLELGEGPELVAPPGTDMVRMLVQEDWFSDTGRHECRVVARKSWSR